jgi:hypothetical protein
LSFPISKTIFLRLVEVKTLTTQDFDRSSFTERIEEAVFGTLINDEEEEEEEEELN